MQYNNVAKFDIETNGLLNVLDTVHSLCFELDGSRYSCADQQGYRPISYGLEILEKVDVLAGHNIIRFDIPAIQKVYPQWKPRGMARDTLTLARLMFPDIGSHSLEAWGERLKVQKGYFGKQTDWKKWSPAMQSYCERDVTVTMKLWDYLAAQEYPEESIQLEHEFAEILNWQMEMGVPFDVAGAERLADELYQSKELLEARLKKLIPPHREIFVPKANNRRYGYVKGQPITKVTPFNFNSRPQVIDHLTKKHRWEPVDFTDKGNPKLSGDIVRALPYPEAPILADYFDCKKLLGMVAEGDNAWLKMARNGRLYGNINHNGAVTGRCTHSSPNLGQVPRVTSFKGRECRSLFHADNESLLVGCDASGLELRNLAHYMFPYDGGDYGRKILESDIHTENQHAAGLETRDNAKTFIYAHNYGAGDRKLGMIVAPESSAEEQTIRGRMLREQFMSSLPALAILITEIKKVAKYRGYLYGLDGRKLKIRSDHMALNTLLQGAGAVIMKKATIIQWDEFGRNRGAYPVLHVHDETQNIIPKESVDEFKRIAEQAIAEAGRHFDFKCPLAGEAKHGGTWADTH